jgi:hypothetical protein
MWMWALMPAFEDPCSPSPRLGEYPIILAITCSIHQPFGQLMVVNRN